MRRAVLVLLSIVIALGLSVAVGGTAGASGPPDVTVHTVAKRISAGAHPTFTYKSYDLHGGSRVVLQRLVGAAWKTVARTALQSGDHHGTLSAPKVGLGRYAYRAAVYRRGSEIVSTGNHRIFAYGSVAIAAVCDTVFASACDSGSMTVQGKAFHYAMSAVSDETSDYGKELPGRANSCRSVTLSVASSSAADGDVYLKLAQAGVKRVIRRTPAGEVGALAAKLTGKAFDLGVATDAGDSFVYLNGHASCYTADGQP